jgi:hypothetical protein
VIKVMVIEFGKRAEDMTEEPAAYLGSVFVPDNRDDGAPLTETTDHLPQLEGAYRTALALEVLAEQRTDRARDELEEAVTAQRCAHTQRVMAQRDYEEARDRSVGALVRELGADAGGGA